MARMVWRQFDRGLWLSGGRDSVPDGGLRRCTGLSDLKEGAVRSARGMRQLSLRGASQFIWFASALWQGSDTEVLRNGVSVEGTFAQTDGALLSFLRAPPQADLLNDWLFVAGGGNPFKIKPLGTDPTKWGIDAPTQGALVGTKNSPREKTIDGMDATTGWARVESAGATPTVDSTLFVSGSGSLRWDFTQSGTNRYEKSVTVDLNAFTGGVKSADQDYIEFWIRLTGTSAGGDPQAENFDWMEVAFALGATDFDDNVYTRRVDGSETVQPIAGLLLQQTGVGQSSDNLTEQDVVAGEGIFGPNQDIRALLNAISQSSVVRQNDVWQKIRLPKASFDRSGSDASLTWMDVRAIRLTFKRSGAISILVDLIRLAGGTGMIGNYKYFTTFKNSETGSRSNSNPDPIIVKSVDRQRVTISNLPVSSDPQVDIVEIWRSLGNGEAFFLAGEVTEGTGSFTDDVADFSALYTGAHLGTADLPDVLQTEELPLDNDPPPDTIREVLDRPHLGRAWFLDSEFPNKVFYSPAGRPESVQGFALVTAIDDELQTIVRWNDTIYAFSLKSIFRIVGEDEPFVAQEVFGAPGTSQPDTVVPTPFGIVYFANDGVRLFDGSQSTLAGFEAIAPVLRGYEVETLEPFVGITATFYKDEYYISDGANYTLIGSLRTGTWRVYSPRFSTLYARDTDDVLYGAIGRVDPGRTFTIDVDDADTESELELQTPSNRIAVDTKGLVQRVFVDIETDGVDVVPTLLVDDVEHTLPTINLSNRAQIEYAVHHTARQVAVRLAGTVETETIIIYGIEVDVYVPGAAA